MYLLMKNFLMFIRLSPSLFYDYYVYFFIPIRVSLETQFSLGIGRDWGVNEQTSPEPRREFKFSN